MNWGKKVNAWKTFQQFLLQNSEYLRICEPKIAKHKSIGRIESLFRIKKRFSQSCYTTRLAARWPCSDPKNFDCRGFTYRFMSIPYRNCELTRKDVRTVGQYQLDYAQGWTLYERSSYSGLCRGRSSSGYRSDDQSGTIILDRYDRYRLDYKFVNRAVSSQTSIRTLEECARECDLQRSRSINDCQAFAFT